MTESAKLQEGGWLESLVNKNKFVMSCDVLSKLEDDESNINRDFFNYTDNVVDVGRNYKVIITCVAFKLL